MKGKPKVGLQLYTLRELLRTPEDISSTLRKVKEIGYRYVQLSGLGNIELARLKDILEREGLEGVSAHVSYDRLIKEEDRVIEEYRFLGVKHLVCPGLPLSLHNDSGYRKVARELSRVGEILSSEGFTLSYHNHSIELQKYNGITGLEIILQESDPRCLQLELDTYWIQHGGGDPVYWCRKFSHRLLLLHLKDMGMERDQQVMKEVGEGNLNWEGIFQSIRDSICEYMFVEQDICQRSPLESVRISLDYLRNWDFEF